MPLARLFRPARSTLALALKFTLLAALLTGGPGAQADGLPPVVRAALARAGVPTDAVSVVVAEAGSPARQLLSYRADQPRNPASVMKLVTTLAALDILGPSWTWKTPVYVDGPVRDGTLHGNLYLKGQGDPKLVIEQLWLLLRRVQSLGIHTIAGDIVLDRSAFEVAEQDPAGFDGEPLRPYNAAPDALLLNFRAVLMTFIPDPRAGVAHVQYEPPLAGVQLQATVPLADGACSGYRQGLQAELSDPTRIAFAGKYPLACGEKVWPLAFADPRSFGVRALEGLWREMGGQLHGSVHDGRVPEGLAPVFEFASPPLADIVRTINKYSNNVMTQQLFLTLSLQTQGKGTVAGSRAIVLDWWRHHFGTADEPLLINSSGLSRDDRITANALARLLQYAWASPVMPELLSSLPVTGQDGTLKPERWHAGGVAHLKTGSLRNVAALAGIVHAPGGRRLVLVAIVNHPKASAARPAFEALVDWARRQPEPAATRRPH